MSRPTAARPITPALVLLFASMGASSATVPAVIPVIALAGDGALEEYLRAVPALFFGLLVGVLITSATARVIRPRVACVIGGVLQAAAFLALAIVAAPAPFVAIVFMVGLGFGFVEAGGSVLARAVSAAGTARLLSALTGTVAIVAAGIPLLVAFTPFGRTPHVVFLLVAAIHVAGVLIVMGAQDPVGSEEDDEADATGATARQRRPAGTVVGVVGAALALYVGVETVYAGWSSTIPLLAFGVPAQQAAVGTSIFWVLLAIGRYLATAVLRGPVPPVRYLVVSTCVAAVGLGVTAATIGTWPSAAVVALCVAVAALGPCYSLILGAALGRLPVANARWATGLLVACGAGGGAVVPTILLAAADDPTSPIVFVVTGVLTFATGIATLLGTRAKRLTLDPVPHA